MIIHGNRIIIGYRDKTMKDNVVTGFILTSGNRDKTTQDDNIKRICTQQRRYFIFFGTQLFQGKGNGY